MQTIAPLLKNSRAPLYDTFTLGLHIFCSVLC